MAFSPEDRENQVWIIADKKGFIVPRSVAIAGVANMVKNMAAAEVPDSLSGGITGMISAVGSPKKACMAHCDEVADKIREFIS